MKQKKLIMTAAITLLAGGSALTGFLLPWKDLVASLPFPGKSTEETTAPKNPELKKADSPSGGETAALEHAAEIESPGPASKGEPDRQVALVAAADFMEPHSRSSLVVKTMREITLLQTAMANGNDAAPVKLRAAMIKMPTLVAGMAAKQISSSEVEALALYVLSGGEPSTTTQALKSESLSTIHRTLLVGVFSYATGDAAKAAEKLLPMDIMQFETVLAAQLAIAQVQLAPTADIEKNIALLAYAADTVPGTLIEEAAIRRIIVQFDHKNAVEDSLYWAARYLRRYSRSLYYRDFESVFIAALSKVLIVNAEMDGQKLANIFRVADEAKAESIARQSLLSVIHSGNSEGCARISSAMGQSHDLAKPRFNNLDALFKICKAAGDDEKNLEAMKLIDGTQLDQTVAHELSGAIALAETIRQDHPLRDDGSFGPHQPLSMDKDYSDLFASVAQQLDATVKSINRADGDETGSSK